MYSTSAPANANVSSLGTEAIWAILRSRSLSGPSPGHIQRHTSQHGTRDRKAQYSRVYWENTSADPFTQAQLKELTLARGFKPGFHGATTLPMHSHLTRGASHAPSQVLV